MPSYLMWIWCVLLWWVSVCVCAWLKAVCMWMCEFYNLNGVVLNKNKFNILMVPYVDHDYACI